MNTEKKILFAVDGSDFSEQSLTKTGELMKTDNEARIMLFHGAPCPESVEREAGSNEAHEAQCRQEAHDVLERAKAALTKSGFDPNRFSVTLEKACQNPAVSMLKYADCEGYDTIALGRWGKSTVSRQVIGSVTYRLAQMADDRAVWIIDPRIASHNVMIGLVGAPVSQRVIDYTVRYFGHLKSSTFTLFHVIPPLPPQNINLADVMAMEENENRQQLLGQKIGIYLREYSDKVKENAGYAMEKLTKAGIPEENVFVKIQSQETGIARDIIAEMETGNHGILVIGRRGFKDIKDFGMGSKAYKLLMKARAFDLCLVS